MLLFVSGRRVALCHCISGARSIVETSTPPKLLHGGHISESALGIVGPLIMAPIRSNLRNLVPLRHEFTFEVFMLLNGS